jgi:S-adenosylmethionine synthetase
MNDSRFEVVERKGLGHPDTLADGIAEAISIEYSKFCLERFGVILHHNVDKIMLVGGSCNVDFGIAELTSPIRVVLNGRMSRCFGSVDIDIRDIQTRVAMDYISGILSRLDADRDLTTHVLVSSSSRIPYWFSPRNKDDVPDYSNPHVNDTATVTSFWPLSNVETVVLHGEKFFYNDELKPRFDFVGHDIKITGIRRDRELQLVACVPFFAEKVADETDYKEKKALVQESLLDHLRDRFSDTGLRITLSINTQDLNVREGNAKGHYLTVTGSALDYGEEGVVGRGNRCRGLISGYRPSMVEASYGKNPVYHVGKVYSHAANVMSSEITAQTGFDVSIMITCRNGDPLYAPYNIIVSTSGRVDEGTIRDTIHDILQQPSWTEEIITGKVFLPTTELLSGTRRI